MTAEELAEPPQTISIPSALWTSLGVAFEGLEALCLLWARFRSAGDLNHLTVEYDRPQPTLSQIINWLVTFFDEHWQHLFDCDKNRPLSSERLSEYAEAIHSRDAPIKTVRVLSTALSVASAGQRCSNDRLIIVTRSIALSNIRVNEDANSAQRVPHPDSSSI
jgi:hypothetical protein